MSENKSNTPCQEHQLIIARVDRLEDAISELKTQIEKRIDRNEFKVQIEHIEDQIKALKNDSDEHFKSSMDLQNTLARLDEFTKYLKESLALNQETTKQLMDKVDKMYELMLTSVNSRNNQKEEVKNEIKVINDSNNGNSSINRDNRTDNGGKSDSKMLDYLKSNGLVLVILVAIIAYLITGHWPL